MKINREEKEEKTTLLQSWDINGLGEKLFTMNTTKLFEKKWNSNLDKNIVGAARWILEAILRSAYKSAY